MAVNEVGWTTGFGTPDNRLLILDAADAVIAEVAGSKREVADGLLDAVLAARRG